MLAGEPAAWAQTGAMPPEIESRIRALGRVIDPPETAKLYAPLHENEPYAGVKVVRDLKYGPDERHALDVFVDDPQTGQVRPVLMYVHGGGFTAGNKRAPGSPFFDNIMLLAARNGMVGVNVTYRLAPQHQWPAGSEDVAAAVRWVGDNIKAHGCDPARVFLIGHSAGGVHVATYVAHSRFHGPKGIGLAGAIFISALYEFAPGASGPAEKAYFAEDAAKLAEGTTLAQLPKVSIPLMVVHAELDPPVFETQAKRLNEALCKAERCPRQVFLPKHSHISETYSINTKDAGLSEQIVAFVKGGK